MRRNLNWIPAKVGTVPQIIFLTDGVYLRLMLGKIKVGQKVIYRELPERSAKKTYAYFEGFNSNRKKFVFLTK